MPSVDSEREGKKHRTRARGRQYRLLREVLWQKQSHRCFYQFPGCTGTNDAIAHKDHNPDNWDPDNIAASCKHCNGVLSNKGRRKSGVAISIVRERNSPGGLETNPSTMAIAINQLLFPRYKDWLAREIFKITDTPVTVKNAIHGGAMYLRNKWGYGSSTTTRKYLDDLTSTEGIFQIVPDKVCGPIVIFKPDIEALDDLLEKELEETRGEQFKRTFDQTGREKDPSGC